MPISVGDRHWNGHVDHERAVHEMRLELAVVQPRRKRHRENHQVRAFIAETLSATSIGGSRAQPATAARARSGIARPDEHLQARVRQALSEAAPLLSGSTKNGYRCHMPRPRQVAA
jgi:hypothetical protein